MAQSIPDDGTYFSSATDGKQTGTPASEQFKAGMAAKRYAAGATVRQPYLDRARRNSHLTVPSLFQEAGEAESAADQILAWQSLGSWGVNSLATKQVLALFPPGLSFVKLKQNRKALKDLMQMPEEERGKLNAAIDRGLSGVEVELVECIEEDGDRVQLGDAKRHLVVGGNHCLRMHDDATLQSISLDSYVTWRTPSGQLLEWCIEEAITYEALDDDVKELIKNDGWLDDNNAGKDPQGLVTVYQYGCWKRGTWRLFQEVCGQIVPNSEWTYTDEALPWMFLREIALKKEHYGRSYVEDYEADLQTLDGFWQLVTEGAAASALLKWLIRAGGTTNKDTFTKLPNGGVMTGEPDDVHAARADKGGDLQVAFNMVEKLEARLERIFLLFSSVQRKGERVTKEEIVTVRQDLENNLGGVYANAVTTLQMPYAKRKLAACQRQGRVTQLPKDAIKLTVLTGDAGIGRAARARDLDEFMLEASAALLNNPAVQYLSVRNYLERKGANKQIDLDGLLKTQEQVDEDTAQQQQMAISQQVAPNVVDQAGQMMQQQLAAPPADQQPAAA